MADTSDRQTKRARSDNGGQPSQVSYSRRKSDESNRRASQYRSKQIEEISKQIEEVKETHIESDELQEVENELRFRKVELILQEHFAKTKFPRWFYQTLAQIQEVTEEDPYITATLGAAPAELSAMAIASKLITKYKANIVSNETRVEGGKVFLFFETEENYNDFEKKYKTVCDFGTLTKLIKREAKRYTLVLDKRYVNVDMEKLKQALTLKAHKAPINIHKSENGYHFINFDDQEAMKKALNPPLIPIKEVSSEIVGEFLEPYEASTNIYNHPYVLWASRLPKHPDRRIITQLKNQCKVNVVEISRRRGKDGLPTTYGHIAFATPDDARSLHRQHEGVFAKPINLKRALLHEQFRHWIDDWNEQTEVMNQQDKMEE